MNAFIKGSYQAFEPSELSSGQATQIVPRGFHAFRENRC